MFKQSESKRFGASGSRMSAVLGALLLCGAGPVVSGVALGAPAASGGAPANNPPPLILPLVEGHDSYGLQIPDLDENGHLRSLFVIGALSRVDDRNVEIRESYLETYHEDGSPDLSIDLPKATLDRFTRVMVAKVPVTIRREEFEVTGASMEFNTLTREGGLGGPVTMTIYNLGFAGGGDPSEKGEDSLKAKDNEAPGSPGTASPGGAASPEAGKTAVSSKR